MNQDVSKKVFLLCEEKEGDDAIRTFTILTTSEDKEALRQLLEAKVAKDEYGLFAENGIRDNGPYYYSSESGNDSFVEYYILEENVQTREQTLALLNTPEYSDVFAFPDNMRQILLGAIRAYTEDYNYGTLDIEKVADAIMADKSFHSALGKSFWFNESHIPELHQERAENACYYFIQDTLDENKEYFKNLGVFPDHSCPENLEDIVIDNIYNVAKQLHLPVEDAEKQAAYIMRNNDFLKEVSALCSRAEHLVPGTGEYEKVAAICYKQVVTVVAKDMSEVLQQAGQKGRSLNNLIQSAEARVSDAGRTASPQNLQR